MTSWFKTLLEMLDTVIHTHLSSRDYVGYLVHLFIRSHSSCSVIRHSISPSLSLPLSLFRGSLHYTHLIPLALRVSSCWSSGAVVCWSNHVGLHVLMLTVSRIISLVMSSSSHGCGDATSVMKKLGPSDPYLGQATTAINQWLTGSHLSHRRCYT
jgi:hypothetical protein